MSDIRRQTAYKCSIKQLQETRYVQQQGLNPNYIDLNGKKAARVNIIAILVSKENNILTIDDGTGQLQIMLFEERLKNNLPQLGQLAQIIGKPREHNNKRFLVPEIIKELKNQKWMDYRRKELQAQPKINKQEKNTQKEPIQDVMPDIVENYQEKIITEIKKLDKGEGAPYQELINSLNMKNAEEKIEELIKEGEIFEIKGKLKIL